MDAVSVLGSRGVCLLSPDNTEVIVAQWRVRLKSLPPPPLLLPIAPKLATQGLANVRPSSALQPSTGPNSVASTRQDVPDMQAVPFL